MPEPVLVSEQLEVFDFVLFRFHFAAQSIVLVVVAGNREKKI